jgi:hypothetical protein
MIGRKVFGSCAVAVSCAFLAAAPAATAQEGVCPLFWELTPTNELPSDQTLVGPGDLNGNGTVCLMARGPVIVIVDDR